MFNRLRARWHLAVGRLFVRLRCYRFAANQFESAILLFPQHLVAQCLLGWTCQELNQHDKALLAFDRAHEIAPNSPYAPTKGTFMDAPREVPRGRRCDKPVVSYTAEIQNGSSIPRSSGSMLLPPRPNRKSP